MGFCVGRGGGNHFRGDEINREEGTFRGGSIKRELFPLRLQVGTYRHNVGTIGGKTSH